MYGPDLFIRQAHKDQKPTITLTINSDGVNVFRKQGKDTWPVFLVINELGSKKFDIQNIIFAAINFGTKKITAENFERVILEIHRLENNGINVNGENFEIYLIYGSFDKPASSMASNKKSCTSTFGCRFCLSKRQTINNRKLCSQGKASNAQWRTKISTTCSFLQ